MHPDASLSPIPDVPSGDERSDHDTPKRGREGAKVSAFNAKFAIRSPDRSSSSKRNLEAANFIDFTVRSKTEREGVYLCTMNVSI